MNANTNPTEPGTDAQSSPDPQPWDRQPGEPLDRYKWFQVYLCLPLPRTFMSVTQIAGLKPASRLVSRAAGRWRWIERAAASDDPRTGCLALQSEWRQQLISEIAYQSRFIALEETTLALAGAEIGEMDRTGARRHLNTLLRHQRGLHRLTSQRDNPARGKHEEDGRQRLVRLVEERAREIVDEWFEELLQEIYGDEYQGPRDETDDDSGSQCWKANDPGQIKPWHQQPGEPAGQFYLFQIYLSLILLQSTAHVARMAKISRKHTVDKIARKWNWQQRAAAFDAEHAADPFVRLRLRERLIRDRAYTAQLQGLLDTAKALETAQLGKLGRARARNALSSLSRHQRSLLQPAFRQQETVDENTFEQSSPPRLDPNIEELALQRAHELWKEDEERARRSGYEDESVDTIFERTRASISPPPDRARRHRREDVEEAGG